MNLPPKWPLDAQSSPATPTALAEAPDAPGLYAVWLNQGAEPLPSRGPRNSAPGKQLLYIGQSQKPGLRKRLRNELLGVGHGTLFRSLGVALDFYPPRGSLASNTTTYNFSFSPSDTERIVEWIAANVEFSCLGLETPTINASERLAIKRSAPLLNLRHNPCGEPVVLAEIKARRHRAVMLARNLS